MVVKKPIKLVILLAITAILIIFPFLKNADSVSKSTISAPRMQSYEWMSLSEWFILHAEDVALAEDGQGKIVFLGDSIIQNWYETQAWKKHFEPLMALNFGIGGDMTQNLLWRLENGGIGNLNPEKIVLMIGTNNLSYTDDTPKEISQGVISIVNKLTNEFLETKVLLMGILPREKQSDHPNRTKVKQLNQYLQSLENLDNITFLDIGEQFLLSDKTISPELMPDFLHLSEKGYETWAREIFKWINSVQRKNNQP